MTTTKMSPYACRESVRAVGLCGRILDGDSKLCICPRGHDGGVHDRGWEVVKRVEEDPRGRDSREATTMYRVVDQASGRIFETTSADDAAWLASTLTRLDL